MRVFLSVGHSKLKNGSITSADGTKMGGINEYAYCKSLSKLVKQELEKAGHEVDRIVCPEGVFDKPTDEKTYKLAIEHKTRYDVVIELHLNAADNSKAEGCEVLYKSAAGKKYAESVQRNLAKLFKDRGVAKRDNLYMLNQTHAPAIIVESFFCTNPKECEYASDHKTKIAKLIANGVDK